MVNTIKRQSELIRQLIADLNLASKLSDDAFPLHRTVCLPAQTPPECVADIYNAGLEERFSIDLLLSEATEQITFMGDESLLKRAMRNILGNCIRHNPEGCRVTVSVDVSGRKLKFLCQDTGKEYHSPSSIVWNRKRKRSGRICRCLGKISRISWECVLPDKSSVCMEEGLILRNGKAEPLIIVFGCLFRRKPGYIKRREKE